MRARNLFILSLAALGLASFAHGQGLVDVAFTWGSPTPLGAAYIGSTGDAWNQFLGPATTTSVNYYATGAVQSAGTGAQPDLAPMAALGLGALGLLIRRRK